MASQYSLQCIVAAADEMKATLQAKNAKYSIKFSLSFHSQIKNCKSIGFCCQGTFSFYFLPLRHFKALTWPL